MIATDTFRRLSPTELASLVQDEFASQLYLDVLSLLDDLLCPYLSEPRHAVFQSSAAFMEQLDHVRQGHSVKQDIDRNITENVKTAFNLHNDAERMRQSGDAVPRLDIAVDQFVDALAAQYALIAQEY